MATAPEGPQGLQGPEGRRGGHRGFAVALSVAALALIPAQANQAVGAEPVVDFAQQIRPILAKNCFACHGPDEKQRKAHLRLDTRDGAFADHDGSRAFVAGDAGKSEALARITTADADDHMPPADTGKTLTAKEVALLTAWIKQGAVWGEHWSLAKLARPEAPATPFDAFAKSDFDRFVHARLQAEGLRPSPEADRYTLARRVTLDLTGLPPTPEEVDGFVRDAGARGTDVAYGALVDRLLAAPAYGERWARVWLDLARYADSRGYEKDRGRTIWRYRDWVIQALNKDMPFSQFTVEQIAGDLLPHATSDQILATAFHRNTLTNDEGGTDDEEFRIAAVKDRVDTTLQVWMGLTVGCAKCHDHKYDPITQKDYYRLMAFFNQSEDADRGDDSPLAPMPTDQQRQELDAVTAKIGVVDKEADGIAAHSARQQIAWERQWLGRIGKGKGKELTAAKLTSAKLGNWYAVGPFSAEVTYAPELTVAAPETERFDAKQTFDEGRLKWHEEGAWKDGAFQVVVERPGSLMYLTRTLTVAGDRTVSLALAADRVLKVWLDGRVVAENESAPSVRLFVGAGEHRLLVKVSNHNAPQRFFFKLTGEMVVGEPIDVARSLVTPARTRTDAQRKVLRDHFLREYQPEGRDVVARLEVLRGQQHRLEEEQPKIPIMRDLAEAKRRPTHLQIRGNFLDKGDVVEAATPGAFHPLPGGAPRSRLGVARWLVDDANPLTARVAVNRHWAQLFGVGLVETEEDFGTQGLGPSHPQLLDWLASEFVRHGWSGKWLSKAIVTSATYRQSARATPAALERDRFNRLLARGPRFRLEAEMVRDNALAVSGLLSHKLYGPSVMPPQPDGIWSAVYSGQQWVTAKGEDRYRRGLYTYIRRTSPYPSMVTFDAPSREVCSVRRIRSNTPLQALVTLNDPVYVEAAQALARRMAREIDGAAAERIGHGFRLALARPASAEEIAQLVALYERRRDHYRKHAKEAEALAAPPPGAPLAGTDVVDLAALTSVSNVILNLDEFLTRG